MGRNARRDVGVMTFAEATCPSEIRRKRMSRKESSLSTSPEKLGKDGLERDQANSQLKSRRGLMASLTLSLVWISYRSAFEGNEEIQTIGPD